MARASTFVALCISHLGGTHVEAIQIGESMHTWRSETPPAPERSITNFVQLDKSEVHERGSYCLDGEMPGFYYEPASNSTRWILALQGGGWCKTEAECVRRTKSSLQGPAPETASGLTIFDGDAFKSFHHVLVRYCDGGIFSGDRPDPVTVDDEETGKPTVLYFRGRRILDHVLHTLSKNFGFSEATEVLLSGGSAGGLATFVLADYIGSNLPVSVHKYRAVPQSGFWAKPAGDYQGYDETLSVIRFPGHTIPVVTEASNSLKGGEVKQLSDVPEEKEGLVETKLKTFKNFVDLHNIGDIFTDNCKNAMPEHAKWHCVFADVSYTYSATPMFVMQAIDEFMVTQNQTQDDLLDPLYHCMLNLRKNGYTTDPAFACNRSFVTSLNGVMDGIVLDLQSSPKYSRQGEGGFITSCNMHANYKTNRFNVYSTHDVSMNQAVQNWYSEEAGADPKWYLPCHYNVEQPYQCEESCGLDPYGGHGGGRKDPGPPKM